MARFVTGKTFDTTETVTAALLNQAVNDAAISTDSVDGSTIEVNSNALRLKDSSSKTTGVTFAKMQHISTAKVLGRASASEGDVEEAFDFKDEDNMSSNSATALASQQSIKAYVDASSTDGFTPTASASDTKSVTLPNGLIMKFGRVSINGSGVNTTVNFSDFGGNFPNACFSVVLTEERDGGETNSTRLASQPTTSSFETENHLTGSTPINFIAIGR